MQTQITDLPDEILEKILALCIIEELRELHLAKRVWVHHKANVALRLREVCCHWNKILTRNVFSAAFHREFMCSDVRALSLSLVAEKTITGMSVSGMTKAYGKLYVLANRIYSNGEDTMLIGYECKTKDGNLRFRSMLPLPKVRSPECLVACHNCLYVSDWDGRVYRIRVNDRSTSLWLESEDCNFFLSVSNCGNLIVSCLTSSTVNVYRSDGSVLLSVQLPNKLKDLCTIVQKPTGNFVVAHGLLGKMLSEVCTDGHVVRQSVGICQSARKRRINIAFVSPQLFILNYNEFFYLFDVELNWFSTLKFPDGVRSKFHSKQLCSESDFAAMHYDAESRTLFYSVECQVYVLRLSEK